jgi:hypothetical protein
MWYRVPRLRPTREGALLTQNTCVRVWARPHSTLPSAGWLLMRRSTALSLWRSRSPPRPGTSRPPSASRPPAAVRRAGLVKTEWGGGEVLTKCVWAIGHVALAAEGTFYVIGGTVNGVPDATMWAYDIASGEWTPSALGNGAAHGPCEAHRGAERRSLTLSTGVRAGDEPPGLLLGAGAYVPPLRRLYVMGGFSTAVDRTALVWSYDIDALAWRGLANSMAPQACGCVREGVES